MNLLIDLGNTRLKWGYEENGQLLHPGAIEHYHADFLQQLAPSWNELERPEKILLSSVASEEKTACVLHWFEQNWRQPVQEVKAVKKGFGITNAYTEPHKLGSDRWLAMIAVFKLGHAPFVVVSCGSAITIDLVDVQGQHLGGYIAPGLRMMQNSLVQGTGARHIGCIEVKGALAADDEPATSTMACVANGCMLAATGYITQAVSRFESLQEDKSVSCILSGGDADTLLGFLPAQFEYLPDLVLNGLAMVAGD